MDDPSSAATDPLAPVVLRDDAHQLTATVLTGAGLLISSLTHRGEELLGQRRGVDAYVRDGKTMGIPLLFPWANRLGADRFTVGGHVVDCSGEVPGLRRDPAGLPIHGLLAASADWAVQQAPGGATPPGELVATLDLAARPEWLAAFPFPQRVTYRAELDGGRLRIAISVLATSATPVPLAFGLHPYLTLPGVPRELWHVELPPRTQLMLDERGLPTGAGLRQAPSAGPLGEQEFDDAYEHLDLGARFVLEGGGRRITTTFEHGYPAAQIFAPRSDAVICFEPMAAPTNALLAGLAPFTGPHGAGGAAFSIAVADA